MTAEPVPFIVSGVKVPPVLIVIVPALSTPRAVDKFPAAMKFAPLATVIAPIPMESLFCTSSVPAVTVVARAANIKFAAEKISFPAPSFSKFAGLATKVIVGWEIVMLDLLTSSLLAEKTFPPIPHAPLVMATPGPTPAAKAVPGDGGLAGLDAGGVLVVVCVFVALGHECAGLAGKAALL